MKKNIVLFCLTAILGPAYITLAQDNSPQQEVHWFEADGSVIYDVNGCVPGSDISFYSQQGGGRMLKQTAVNANGHASVIWKEKTVPAFVINVPGANAAGAAGTGIISYTENKDFTINSESLDNVGGNVILNWKAAVCHPDNFSFDILKSVNGGAYMVIQTVKAQGSDIDPYAFTDATQTNGSATYQIAVKDNSNNIYYTTHPLFTDGGSGVSIYPTVAHAAINVCLNDDVSNGSYKIVNMQGQVVTTGVLKSTRNSVAVNQLSAGNYLLEVWNKGNKTTQKFVREQ